MIKEMSVIEALCDIPGFMKMIPEAYKIDFLTDNNYVVRVSDQDGRLTGIEIGYKDDNWQLQG